MQRPVEARLMAPDPSSSPSSPPPPSSSSSPHSDLRRAKQGPFPDSSSSSSSSSPAGAAAVQGQNPILFLGFNQDHGRFACGTTNGFRVYDCDPFKEAFTREDYSGNGHTCGGIAVIELLFRSSIMALVGGGCTPRYPHNKVMIWDDHQMCCIGELSFGSRVLTVKLRRDRIVVALETRVYVYNFADFKLLLQIDTVANPKGLCAISSTLTSSVIACPGVVKGQVRIEFLDLKHPMYLSAHDSSLSCLTLTFDGSLLATASSKGTLIRIFNTHDGTQLQEVRRGFEKANIYSISFSANAQWLAVSSDKGTVHVFSINVGRQDGTIRESNITVTVSPSRLIVNQGSSLSFMKSVLPKYFSSERSFCQFRLPEEVNSIVAFGHEKHTIIVVGSDGSFYRCAFDPTKGGEMVEQKREKFYVLDKRVRSPCQ